MGYEIAAERLDLFAGFASDKILPDDGADVIEPGSRVGDERVVNLPHDRRRFIAIMLVVDLADDLFNDVLDRDQPIGAAIFVNHQGQMDARGLHLGQQIDCAHGWRHKQQLSNDVGL